MLVLEGEAGIGKSTLWLAGVEQAHERLCDQGGDGTSHTLGVGRLWVNTGLPEAAHAPDALGERALGYDDLDGTRLLQHVEPGIKPRVVGETIEAKTDTTLATGGPAFTERWSSMCRSGQRCR